VSIIIAKNNTGSAIELDDLGVEIPGAGNRDLTETFTKSEIIQSEDLSTEVSAGNITINDGTDDLSIVDSLRHINFETEYEDVDPSDATAVINHSVLDHTDVVSSPALEGDLLRYNAILEKFIASPTKTEFGPDIPDSTTVVWFSSHSYDLYYFDPVVSDWISISSNFYEFGRSGNVSGAYLGIGGWSTGGYYYVHHPSVITGIHISALSGVSTKGFEIRVNEVPMHSFNLVDYIWAEHSIAVHLDTGDYLQLWCSTTGSPVKDVVCQLVNHTKDFTL
jgi:hypothetical protein